MRLLNQIRHYSGAVVRGIISGRLFTTAGIYLRHRRLESRALSHLEMKVTGGPFKGMQYIRIPAADAVVPKLFGSYEHEIHSFVERAIADQPALILNIGSAEGYYAVGMALRLPKAQVYAYDIDDRARDLCANLSTSNGVSDRVHVRGLCDAAELHARLQSGARALIIIDCEGCEGELLDPSVTPALSSAFILAEIHDFGASHHGQTIRQRFGSTHDIVSIASIPANPERHPELSYLSSEERRTLLTERLATQDWYYLAPRSTRPA